MVEVKTQRVFLIDLSFSVFERLGFMYSTDIGTIKYMEPYMKMANYYQDQRDKTVNFYKNNYQTALVILEFLVEYFFYKMKIGFYTLQESSFD